MLPHRTAAGGYRLVLALPAALATLAWHRPLSGRRLPPIGALRSCVSVFGVGLGLAPLGRGAQFSKWGKAPGTPSLRSPHTTCAAPIAHGVPSALRRYLRSRLRGWLHSVSPALTVLVAPRVSFRVSLCWLPAVAGTTTRCLGSGYQRLCQKLAASLLLFDTGACRGQTPRRRLRAVALHYSRSAMKAALVRGSWSFALVASNKIVRLAIATLPPNSRFARGLRWAPFVSLLRTAPPALATLGEIGCSQWLRHLLHVFCRLPRSIKQTPRRRLRAVALHYSRSAMKAALVRGSWSFALVASNKIVRLAIATLPPNSRFARGLRWAPSVSLLRTAPPALSTLGEIGCSQWLRHILHVFCRLPHRTGAAHITPAAPSVASPRFARSAQFPHPPPPRSRLRHCLSQSLPGSVALSRYYACSAPSTARWLRSLPWLPSRL